MTTIDNTELVSILSRLENDAEALAKAVSSAESAVGEAQELSRQAAARIQSAEEALNQMKCSLNTALKVIDDMKIKANCM